MGYKAKGSPVLLPIHLAMEEHNRWVEMMVHFKLWKPFKIRGNKLQLSHMLYFGEATLDYAMVTMHTLKESKAYLANV